MKNLTLLGLALLVLAACGKEEPAQPQTTAPAVAEDPMAEAATEATEAPVTEETEAVVVEESAAEPEEDEQAIVLAQAEVPAASHDWQFEEGRHYQRLVPTQPTIGGADKIEVAEFFWYGCPHCWTFEPTVNRWAENDKPANVRFVRVPAMWNNLLVLHGRLFYTEEILARNGTIEDPELFRETVFEEYHRRGNRLASEGAIQKLFERFGVSEEEFARTWNSFEVDQKMRVATDLARRYSISSVPAIVVNGKYRTGAQEVGSNEKWMELVDELILRESAR
ncbi:MAG: thiol:disulfide interchange protein DsbA/DsbL [Woeseiaceae bacterium]|nr:thiol:disulfide interchange protein DsbA/DsbL [Woeseiaceae bacterium]